jgi:hypothetical protein
MLVAAGLMFVNFLGDRTWGRLAAVALALIAAGIDLFQKTRLARSP